MKNAYYFFILVLLCGLTNSAQSMDPDANYTSCRKSGELRNSKEKEKPSGHIPRKKDQPRRGLRYSDKEKHVYTFVHDIDGEDCELDKVPVTRSRSRSFSISVPTRRSSTGQIDRPVKSYETEVNFSPRIQRQNSQGSIEVPHGSPKWLILTAMRAKQDEAKEAMKDPDKIKEKIKQDKEKFKQD